MTEPTASSENLHLLHSLDAFQQHALEMVRMARRQITLLSRDLDFPLYDHQPFCDAVSELARSSRYAHVEILVKQTQPIVERGHQLAALARRLPSKINIRRLTLEPQNKTMAYLIVDKSLLLYKNDESDYQGFANYSARPEAQRLLEEFLYLWESHSCEDPQLRQLNL